MFEKGTRNYVLREINDTFGYEVDWKECTMDVSQFYNPGRRQYDADLMLEAMAARAPEGYLKYIGIFHGDLYIPILTYIFGQAQLNGLFGIASLYRLRNELYGLPENVDLMLERFGKVVNHELGHTFGLIHCLHPGCIMRSSNYVEDLDQKGKRLCKECSKQLLQPE